MPEHWPTSRTEAFSDGVFAIAITLLVLEISVPESEFDNLWRGIAGEWPSYLAFVTSFLTIGGIWLAHHGVFARMRHVDPHVMRLNILLLLAVSFLPFPTRLMAEAMGHSSAERAAVIFYGSALLAIFTLLGALWGAVARDPRLLRSGVSEEEVQGLLSTTSPSIGSIAAVLVLAVFAPHVAAFGFSLAAVLLIWRARGD